MGQLTDTVNAIYTANAYLLDACGRRYGLERKWGEYDEDFRKRLLHKIQEEPNEMSREQIVNKSSANEKPKSEWFGYKYRVNPETSKLLQEAVFKDGGGWRYQSKTDVRLTDSECMFVDENGWLSHQSSDYDYFNNHPLPEKEPPQPSKTLNEQFNDLIKRLEKANNTCVDIEVVNPTSEIKWPEQTKSYREINLTNFLNQQEESNMSNKVNRRVLNIQLLDNDAGLPVEHSLVAEFNGVVTEDSNEITLQEIISTGEVAKHIEAHNKVRAEQVDQTILQNTGQTVKLRPVKLKDLTWNIK